MKFIFLKHGSFFSPLLFLDSKTFHDLRRSSGLLPCWGGGLQAICLGNGEIEQQMSFWRGCRLCPGREATCQRGSTGTRTAADSSGAATEAPALGLGRGRLKRGGGWAELQNGSAEPSLLAPRPGWKQELESPTPLSFIEDLKAVLGPQETTRRSLLSSSGHFLPMSFFFFKS